MAALIKRATALRGFRIAQGDSNYTERVKF